jgi:two-component system, LytTR family, sensor kinase
VIDGLRDRFRGTALGPTIVIWVFGYILVDAIAVLIGRTPPGLMLAASAPMFALGVSQALVLNGLRNSPSPKGLALRWLLLLVAIAAATAVQTLFDIFWLRWLSLNFMPVWQEWALDTSLQRLLAAGFLYLWTFCLALTLLWAMRASGMAEASTARAATAEAAAAKAVAAALRLQLNPHFLFNTLNSISSLVTLGRKEEAEEMIQRLADFLRASLNSDPMEDVPLAQEIDTIEAYLDLEAARFGDRLSVSIEIDPAIEDAQVPNFILQPLVENAIKHGVSALKGPADLAVEAVRQDDQVVLSVFNTSPDGEEGSRPRVSTGIGLANSRKRLAQRYGKNARIETGPVDEGYRATIWLPFEEHMPA